MKNHPSCNLLNSSGLRHVATLAAAAAFTASASAAVVLADDFTTNGTTRTDGAALNGVAVQTGSGNWSANTNAIFRSSTPLGAVNGSTNSQAEGVDARLSLAFDPAAITTITVDFRMHTSSIGSNQAGMYVALGFLTDTDVSTPDDWQNTTKANADTVLWTRVGRWGSSEVRTFGRSGSALASNGTYSTTSSTAALPGDQTWWSNSTTYTLSLSYNPVSFQASMTISNGDTVVVNSGWFATGLTADDNDLIKAVGLRFRGNGTSSFLDNFSVTTTAIPEPASWSVLLGGGALLLASLRLRGRRR
jgi:hypothetical protein